MHLLSLDSVVMLAASKLGRADMFRSHPCSAPRSSNGPHPHHAPHPPASVMVEAASELGLIDMLGGWLAAAIRAAPQGARTIVAIQILLWGSALISAVLDNMWGADWGLGWGWKGGGRAWQWRAARAPNTVQEAPNAPNTPNRQIITRLPNTCAHLDTPSLRSP